ncbi:SDR family NAD(P)-dependent oxidoreductase [Yinghuangia aomiensis]
MPDLHGKTALITGAARGMGESHARHFIACGAKVVLGDVLDKQGRAVADDLGDNACYVHLDVTSETDWRQAVDTAVSRFGHLDVLVNNAGVQPVGLMADTSVEDFRRCLDINAVGQFIGIKAVTDAMTAAGGGSIVNISSTNGFVGKAAMTAYTASKFAVRGLTRSAALELGHLGIRVNSVHPGGIDTDMLHDPAHGGADPTPSSRPSRSRASASPSKSHTWSPGSPRRSSPTPAARSSSSTADYWPAVTGTFAPREGAAARDGGRAAVVGDEGAGINRALAPRRPRRPRRRPITLRRSRSSRPRVSPTLSTAAGPSSPTTRTVRQPNPLPPRTSGRRPVRCLHNEGVGRRMGSALVRFAQPVVGWAVDEQLQVLEFETAQRDPGGAGRGVGVLVVGVGTALGGDDCRPRWCAPDGDASHPEDQQFVHAVGQFVTAAAYLRPGPAPGYSRETPRFRAMGTFGPHDAIARAR